MGQDISSIKKREISQFCVLQNVALAKSLFVDRRRRLHGGGFSSYLSTLPKKSCSSMLKIIILFLVVSISLCCSYFFYEVFQANTPRGTIVRTFKKRFSSFRCIGRGTQDALAASEEAKAIWGSRTCVVKETCLDFASKRMIFYESDQIIQFRSLTLRTGGLLFGSRGFPSPLAQLGATLHSGHECPFTLETGNYSKFKSYHYEEKPVVFYHSVNSANFGHVLVDDLSGIVGAITTFHPFSSHFLVMEASRLSCPGTIGSTVEQNISELTHNLVSSLFKERVVNMDEYERGLKKRDANIDGVCFKELIVGGGLYAPTNHFPLFIKSLSVGDIGNSVGGSQRIKEIRNLLLKAYNVEDQSDKKLILFLWKKKPSHRTVANIMELAKKAKDLFPTYEVKVIAPTPQSFEKDFQSIYSASIIITSTGGIAFNVILGKTGCDVLINQYPGDESHNDEFYTWDLISYLNIHMFATDDKGQVEGDVFFGILRRIIKNREQY
jgi:hypothetical protein